MAEWGSIGARVISDGGVHDIQLIADGPASRGQIRVRIAHPHPALRAGDVIVPESKMIDPLVTEQPALFLFHLSQHVMTGPVLAEDGYEFSMTFAGGAGAR